MSNPLYRVIVRLPGANFGPGAVLVEFENAKNLGYGEYLNDIGEAFWTITQGDPKLELITDALLEQGLHVQIFRNGTMVWAGWIGETDETEVDVIFYAYSYAVAWFVLHTTLDDEWDGKQVDQIVSDIYGESIARVDSLMGWMSIGTLEAPVTTSGGAVAIIVPKYSAARKRFLFVLQELVGLAASDTTNRVVFEVTPTGVMNLWKNKGTTRTEMKLEYGGNVVGFHRLTTPMDRRNVVFGIGTSPHDILLEDTEENTTDRSTNGRREEAVYFSWVRDAEEIDRVTKFRLTRALRTDNFLSLSILPGSVAPARSADATFEIGDMLPVKIDKEMTQINEPKLATGQQVIVTRGQEHLRLIVQDSL
jgi:hypothetical protein